VGNKLANPQATGAAFIWPQCLDLLGLEHIDTLDSFQRQQCPSGWIVGVSFSINLKGNLHMPFLPFLGITFGSLALLKLGALSVLVGVLQSVIGLLLIVIVGLIALLALRYVKKP
jgi:hypothetical protein